MLELRELTEGVGSHLLLLSSCWGSPGISRHLPTQEDASCGCKPKRDHKCGVSILKIEHSEITVIYIEILISSFF